MGWLGLVFPEEYGGEGLGFVDLSILLEEMGRALLPGPYFSTVVMAGTAIAASGSDEQKREYLGGIARGQVIATLALTEPSGRWDARGVEARAERSGDGFVIRGTKLYVPNAHVSDYIVVAVRTGDGERDISLFVVPRGADGLSETTLRTIASDKRGCRSLGAGLRGCGQVRGSPGVGAIGRDSTLGGMRLRRRLRGEPWAVCGALLLGAELMFGDATSTWRRWRQDAERGGGDMTVGLRRSRSTSSSAGRSGSIP